MLVRLTSSTSGEMIMFAEHAHRLFEIIDKECTARGVFSKEQLPEAIGKLKQAVAEEKQALLEAEHAERAARAEGIKEPEEDASKTDKDAAPESDEISLCQRAHPMIHLMELTLKEDGFILWEADQDF